MNIKINNLEIKKSEKVIFDNLDINFIGEKIKLTGINGSGKTTLLNHIYELDQEKYFYVKQNIIYFEGFSVFENLKIMTKNKYNIDKFNYILNYFKMDDIKDQKINKLSGGQQQISILAIAIASGKKIILLDEIENNLDSERIQKLTKLLNDCDFEFIIVSHLENIKVCEVNLDEYITK